IAFQCMRQVAPVRLVERGRGHDHAGSAVAALEALRVVEGLLQRMELSLVRQALDGRDPAPLGTEGRYQAGMERLAVAMDGAGAAVARVAAFLDAKNLEVSQEGAQALARVRIGLVLPAVHLELHGASSARISSAR